MTLSTTPWCTIRIKKRFKKLIRFLLSIKYDLSTKNTEYRDKMSNHGLSVIRGFFFIVCSCSHTNAKWGSQTHYQHAATTVTESLEFGCLNRVF